MEPLYERVLAFIGDPAADRFEDLALAIFAHQFARCAPYRDFATRRGATPDTVADWRDVPAVPIVAFKRADLTCGVPQRTFLSSGTTQGTATRSRHLLPDLRLYQRSALAGLRRFLFPDVARMRIVSLIASGAELPDSSLAQMVAWAMDRFAVDGSYAAQADGLDVDRLVPPSTPASATVEPLGDPHHQRRVDSRPGRLARARPRLPPAARQPLDGHRRRQGGAPPPVAQRPAARGVERVRHSGLLRRQRVRHGRAVQPVLRHRPRPTASADATRRAASCGPHWARTRILDPIPSRRPRPASVGLLCHVDLANAGSAMAILSEDLAAAVGDGFQLRGRAPGAEERGCSLSAAQWDAA